MESQNTRLLALLCLGVVVSGMIVTLIHVSGDPQPRRLAFIDDSANISAATTTPDPAAATRRATTTAPLKPRTVPVPLRSASFGFTGDFLLHSRVNSAARQNDGTYDYKPLLDPIAGFIESVDWAVCHMEVNLSADNQGLQPFPRFRVPGAIASDAATLGYDSCTTASNHTVDLGAAGALETLDVLESAGLHVTGTARTPKEARTRPHVEVNGISVAHLSYTYWFNGLLLPKDMPWLAAEIDQDRILADAAAAKAAGAEYVIVSLHWGEQYIHGLNKLQRDLAPVLAASPDIDLIIGHHAHVVQPIEKIGDTWVVYGLGNLLANYRQAPRRDELFVAAEIVETAPGSFETELTVVPLYVDFESLVVYPASKYSRPDGLSNGLNVALDSSWKRTFKVLDGWNGFEELVLE